MKKTLILIMALLLIAALSACGNVGLGAGNYKFEKECPFCAHPTEKGNETQ